MKTFAAYIVTTIGEREFGEWLILKEKTKTKALRKLMDNFEAENADDEEPAKFDDNLSLELDCGEKMVEIKGVHEFRTLKSLLKLLPTL